jgi:hypothetical protein
MTDSFQLGFGDGNLENAKETSMLVRILSIIMGIIAPRVQKWTMLNLALRK